VLELLAQSPVAFMATAGVFGLLIGSFLNVVIHRLPLMLERQWRQQCAELSGGDGPAGGDGPGAADRLDLIHPPSACPACGMRIMPWQNIPVLSYLLLRGRCAHCKATISLRYPMVELLGAATAVVAAWKFGYGMSAVAAMIVGWFLIALTFIDLDEQLLPDALTLPLLWLGLTASLVDWAPGTGAAILPVDPRSAILGAVSGYLSLWTVYHLFKLATGKEGMGYGDFKLLAALGAWLGWQMLLPIVLFSALVGAIVGIAMIAARRQERDRPIPFGPFLAAAGWLVMLWGPEIVTRYLGLVGLRR
jgi:leader peptidase (prepilin peptidase)/N-methyltransferase